MYNYRHSNHGVRRPGAGRAGDELFRTGAMGRSGFTPVSCLLTHAVPLRSKTCGYPFGMTCN